MMDRSKMGGIFKLLTLASAFLCTFAHAENWPRFRGPDGTGIAAPGFSSAISEKDFAWTISLPGVGHSSPVIWGDHVYVTSADAKAGKRFALGISTSDGKILWTYEEPFASYRKHGENSFASATPAADDLGLYVAWTTPRLRKVTDPTAFPIWRHLIGFAGGI